MTFQIYNVLVMLQHAGIYHSMNSPHLLPGLRVCLQEPLSTPDCQPHHLLRVPRQRFPDVLILTELRVVEELAVM